MNQISYECVITAGQIPLPAELNLPDNTKVRVTLVTEPLEAVTKLFSPRLADPAQAKDFVLQVTDEEIYA